MSSSYQEIPIGIPASQNLYPSIPYSQNFPNEPDTESSQPLTNPSQHYYPPIYGQQPLLMNQSGQLYGPAHGSNQQPQFLVVPIDPESSRLNMKISDIDKTLKSGCYFCYMIWLYLGIILSFVSIFKLFLSYSACAAFSQSFKGSRAITITITILILASSSVWGLQNSFVFKNAMNDKNLKGARRGFKSMIWVTIYSLIITIAMTVALKSEMQILPPDLQNEYSKVSVGAIVQISAISIFLSLFGAKKVIELLTEREKMVQEMNTRFGTNMA